MPPTKQLHPSTLPSLALIALVAADSVPHQILEPVLELSLTCIYEDAYPQSLAAWLQRLARLEPAPHAANLAAQLHDSIFLLLQEGFDALSTWLSELKSLCSWADEDESSIASTPLHRASPLALYLRRFRISFAKLPFEAAILWWDQTQQWCRGVWIEPDTRPLRRAVADSYARSQATQDYQAARDAASFFDLDDGGPSHGKPQHAKPQYALLNVAFLEYNNKAWDASRDALAEAVQVARNVGDSRCLVTCASLHKRLSLAANIAPRSSSNPPAGLGEFVSGDGSPTPTDLLWDIKHADDEGCPVTSLFATLYASRTLHQCPPVSPGSKEKGRATFWNDEGWEAAYHAVAGNLWSELGSPTLAKLRWSMAVGSIDSNRNLWDVQLSVLEHYSHHLVCNTRTETALRKLLHAVDTTKKRAALGLHELRAWEGIVWKTVVSEAGVVDGTEGVAPSSSLDRQDSTTLNASTIAALLRKTQIHIDCGETVLALSHALRASHVSALHGYEALRLRSVCQVVDCRLAISPTSGEAARGLRELETTWACILTCCEADKELLAVALETRGRAQLLLAAGDVDSLDLAMRSIDRASEVYSSLNLAEGRRRTLALLAQLCHQLSAGSVSAQDVQLWQTRRDAYSVRYAAHGDKARDWDRQQLKKVIDGVQAAVAAKVNGDGDPK